MSHATGYTPSPCEIAPRWREAAERTLRETNQHQPMFIIHVDQSLVPCIVAPSMPSDPEARDRLCYLAGKQVHEKVEGTLRAVTFISEGWGLKLERDDTISPDDDTVTEADVRALYRRATQGRPIEEHPERAELLHIVCREVAPRRDRILAYRQIRVQGRFQRFAPEPWQDEILMGNANHSPLIDSFLDGWYDRAPNHVRS